jgi:hypothetical protein
VKLSDLSCAGFGASAVAALLVGCGGMQPSPTGAAISVIRPAAKSETLLYISSTKKASVYIYRYPKGKSIGTIIGFYAPVGLCSDGNGNVWVTDTDRYKAIGYLDEYAHGGKYPIRTLENPSNSPQACAVDPTTGNLAVADSQDNIAIYPNAQAPPTYYSTTGVVHKPSTITYDNAGNLYVAGAPGQPAWLPRDTTRVVKIKLKPRPSDRGALTWDGQYLTVLHRVGSYDEVWRYELLGSSAQRIGVISVDCCMGDYAIHGSILVATLPVLNESSVTKYPAGGKAFLGIASVDPIGVAISVAPTQPGQ